MPDFYDMHVALCREKRPPKRTPVCGFLASGAPCGSDTAFAVNPYSPAGSVHSETYQAIEEARLESGWKQP